MYNIGFTTVTFRKKSVEEIIDIAKKAGINCIEWGGDVHVPPDNEENAKRVRALCDAAGIKSVSYGSYYRVGFNDMAAFERVCKTADILGVRIVRVWLGLKASAETSEEEFLALCDEAARENAPEKVEKRLAYGEQCSWTERVRQMEDVLYKKGVLHETPEK